MCIPRIVGNILYEIKDEGANYVGYLDEKPVISFDKSQFQVPAKVTFIETGYKIKEIVAGKTIYHNVFDTNEVINFSKLMNDLCGNDKRNNLIAKYVLRTKGSSIILSDRVEQLRALHKMIPNSVLITGTTKKQDREQALKDVGEGRVQCLIASYKIAKEGLDLPILENLFMASPVKDDAVVVQSIGRIQRPFGNKQIANVFDFTDNEVSTLERFYRKRKSIYKKRNWL
jgi:superfamily II DNA or RNA helicase